MINLLPPDVKKEVRFSKYNATLLRYMALCVGIALLMSAILFAGVFQAKNQLSSLESIIDDRRASIQDLTDTQAEAKTIDSKLKKIEGLYEQQSYYSAFLDELGAAMPSWAQVINVSLIRADDTSSASASKEDPKRLMLDLRVDEQTHVPELRELLLKMERVEFIDIQSYSVNEGDPESGIPGGIDATFVLALTEAPHTPLEPTEDGGSQ